MVNTVHPVGSRPGRGICAVQSRIGEPALAEAEQNHKNQGNQKRWHCVDDNLKHCGEFIKHTPLLIAAVHSPEQANGGTEQHRRQRDLEGIPQSLQNQRGNCAFLLVGIPQAPIQNGTKVVPKLHKARLIQMKDLPVKRNLGRGHILL